MARPDSGGGGRSHRGGQQAQPLAGCPAGASKDAEHGTRQVDLLESTRREPVAPKLIPQAQDVPSIVIGGLVIEGDDPERLLDGQQQPLCLAGLFDGRGRAENRLRCLGERLDDLYLNRGVVGVSGPAHARQPTSRGVDLPKGYRDSVDFEFSADQESLRDTVRRFLNDKAPLQPYVREQLLDERGTSPAVWSGLAQLGVTGLLAPAALGGAGMGMVEMGVVLEEMGRLVHPGPFLSSAVGAVSAVCLVATDEQRAELVPGLADGSTVGALAFLENVTRGDWRAPTVLAEGANESWKLRGTKTPVLDACAAGLLFVTASTPDGLGLFAADPASVGISIQPQAGFDATRKAATVTFSNSEARRLGDGSDITEAVSAVVDRMVIGLVTDAVGAAEVALHMAVAYAKERMQFDRPIGSFQAVQHLCADMLQVVEQARAGAYYALWAADAAPPGERHRAATMAKAFSADALFRVGASTVQVLGGVGFTWEHDAHLYYKRLMTLQEAYGGATEHLEELARLVI